MASRYAKIIERIFAQKFRRGRSEFVFERGEIEKAAQALGIKLPKNLGDVIYSMRYRTDLPEAILATATRGREWIIEGAGHGRYRFRLARASHISPRENLIAVKIPDATPEIIGRYAQGDEQALLARVRYNRLIDIFLGIAAYSLQNHLRTSVSGLGQIEIDELYVGVSRSGSQFIIPVQAKGGNDQLSTVQTRQDMAFCAARFPELICRPISAQFMSRDAIALFELGEDGQDVSVVSERHYRLVPAKDIGVSDLKQYAQRDQP
jgi:hypothetical protein